MALAKPLSRSLASLHLRLRARMRLVLLAVVLVVSLALVAVLRPAGRAASIAAPTLRRRMHRMGQSSAAVLNCAHRTPSTQGRTYETEVKGVGVSFVSWTKNETFDKDVVQLRTHEAVRIMGQFDRAVTLLDVGANVGKVTFPVLGMRHTHTVVAVEPVTTNVNMLCLTANLNGWLGYPGFTLLQAALSDKEGEMSIYVPEGREDNAALSAKAATANVHEAQHGEKVRVLVGDEVLRKGELEPELIKIDTQGHEIHVLRGLRRYLRRAEAGRVLVMAESDPKLMRLSGVDPKEVYRLMVEELRYSAYCKPDIKYGEGRLHVSGEALRKQTYPPGGCRDIYYFKQPR